MFLALLWHIEQITKISFFSPYMHKISLIFDLCELKLLQMYLYQFQQIKQHYTGQSTSRVSVLQNHKKMWYPTPKINEGTRNYRIIWARKREFHNLRCPFKRQNESKLNQAKQNFTDAEIKSKRERRIDRFLPQNSMEWDLMEDLDDRRHWEWLDRGSEEMERRLGGLRLNPYEIGFLTVREGILVGLGQLWPSPLPKIWARWG